MKPAVPECQASRFRAVFEGETQVFGGIGDKHSGSPDGVFSLNMPRLVDLQGRVTGIFGQKLNDPVHGLPFLRAQFGVAIQKQHFKKQVEGSGSGTQEALSPDPFEGFARGGGPDSGAFIPVDPLLFFQPIRFEFPFRKNLHVREFPDGLNRIEGDLVSLYEIFKQTFFAEITR